MGFFLDGGHHPKRLPLHQQPPRSLACHLTRRQLPAGISQRRALTRQIIVHIDF